MLKLNVTCPRCGGKDVIRKGISSLKLSAKQVYFCKTCRKKFSLGGLAYKTYSPAVIVAALNQYNLGFTLEETARHVNRRFKVKVSKSTVHLWLKEFADLGNYHRIRDKILSKYGLDIVVSREFEHHGLNYNFKYHRGKLDWLGPEFSGLVKYIKSFEHGAPDYSKQDERPSQLRIELKVKFETAYNQACKMAGLAVKAARTHYDRHSSVETFMLLNDISTIACEIPVWFWEKNMDAGIFGHIDLLQVRHGLVYVLDYKPDAKKEDSEKVASQLFLYASGLSFRTKLPLTMFRCAYFDDTIYCEFVPTEIIVRYHRVDNPPGPA